MTGIDLYDDVPATVCVVHRRFVPCRKGPGCELSSTEDDVFDVAMYQLSGKAGKEAST